METIDRKAKNLNSNSDSVEERQPGVQPAGVSTVPSSITSNGEITKTDISQMFTDYHLTAQLSQHLERRQVSLLLDILNYQSVHYGVNFEMYLFLLHCYEILIGSKVKASEIKDKNERRVALSSQVIIRDLAGIPLAFGDQKVKISEKSQRLLINSRALMTRDVFRSRFQIYRPERLLRLVTVPVDIKFERSGTSVRYSSYCKGYGEGTGTARRGRTPRSFELDGEEVQDEVLGQKLSDSELSQELFLIAHFEWLKRFGAET